MESRTKSQWGVNPFDFSNSRKLLALGGFDMEEEHRKQCKATNRQIDIEAPSPCSKNLSSAI